QIIARVGLPAVTSYSTTDAATLKEKLAQTRERGYSMDNQENELRNYCIGAALFDGSGQVIGACSVAGTDPEIIGKRAPELSDNIRRTALTISRNMGYVPSSISRLNLVTL